MTRQLATMTAAAAGTHSITHTYIPTVMLISSCFFFYSFEPLNVSRHCRSSVTREAEFFEEALALGDMIKNKMAEVLSGVNPLTASRGGMQGSAMAQDDDQDMQVNTYTYTYSKHAYIQEDTPISYSHK
jgi:hypothetical protein